MGMVFGRISVETPPYKVLKTTPEYEIREYAPSVVAQVTYNPSQLDNKRDGGFMILANYIGALGNPHNSKPEKIAMTAPVITAATTTTTTTDHGEGEKEEKPEKIAMTAPVITATTTTNNHGEGEKEEEEVITMQFILPYSKYKKAEEAPKPTDERVAIGQEGERKYGVVRFSGTATMAEVKKRADKLRASLETGGWKVVGRFLLARYNPPWTLPFLRTNEIMIPVE